MNTVAFIVSGAYDERIVLVIKKLDLRQLVIRFNIYCRY